MPLWPVQLIALVGAARDVPFPGHELFVVSDDDICRRKRRKQVQCNERPRIRDRKNTMSNKAVIHTLTVAETMVLLEMLTNHKIKQYWSQRVFQHNDT